jgi:hypothetical protein
MFVPGGCHPYGLHALVRWSSIRGPPSAHLLPVREYFARYPSPRRFYINKVLDIGAPEATQRPSACCAISSIPEGVLPWAVVDVLSH